MFKDDVERVTQALAPLCEPLPDAFIEADQIRKKRLPEFDGDADYAWLATHTIRAFAHFKLGGKNLGPWKLSGKHSRNGELWLTDDSYRIRVLHGPTEEEVPPPGHNGQRKAYYLNPPLVDLAPMFGPKNDKLLIIWRIPADTAVPVFRVVRPIGDWKWGSKAKIDLDFILPDTAEDLAKLRFDPTDQDLELRIPDEREGGDHGAGASAG